MNRLRISRLSVLVSAASLSIFLAGCAAGTKSAGSPPAGDERGTTPEEDSSRRESSSARDPDQNDNPGNESVESSRSMESIVQVIRDNRHLFRLCYEKYQKERPDLKGDVVIFFRITSKGKVIDSQVNREESTLLDEDVGSCIANEMKNLVFSNAHSGMDTEINYPFNFNPK